MANFTKYMARNRNKKFGNPPQTLPYVLMDSIDELFPLY